MNCKVIACHEIYHCAKVHDDPIQDGRLAAILVDMLTSQKIDKKYAIISPVHNSLTL